jgi:hypothetical protein
MALVIATSRIAYRGEDRLDITRGSGRGLGLLFAPSSLILGPALAARRGAAELRKRFAGGLFAAEHERACAEADRIEAGAWETYVGAYLSECERMPWRALTGLGRVVGVCYCADPAQCHRRLWAEYAAKELRAEYVGETS